MTLNQLTVNQFTDVDRVGFVVIGRNEGARLHRCLESLSRFRNIVYVDSNSSDDSVEWARKSGVHVVELDMSLPFSAARARNAGIRRLKTLSPPPEYIQFLDGDCELMEHWVDSAITMLDCDRRLAVVAGRRRERFPDQSLYNRLCDIEWNTPVGEAKACGGDAMIRLNVLDEVGGYNPEVIAGEEPEMCVRIRALGWSIRRIDVDMTLHDAAMLRFGQWWRRMQRSGHAYAHGVSMHGKPPENHWVREQRSILFWAAIVPSVVALSALAVAGLSSFLLTAYLVVLYRSFRSYRARGFCPKDSCMAAGFNLLAKFPQLLGVIKFYVNNALSRRTTLIEYKGAPT